MEFAVPDDRHKNIDLQGFDTVIHTSLEIVAYCVSLLRVINSEDKMRLSPKPA
jgi:hypothetical protein